jgi:hypothetical protein
MDGFAAVLGLLIFFKALITYSPSIICIWLSIRFLRRDARSAIGYGFIACSLIVPAIVIVPVLRDGPKLEARAKEIASWPKVKPHPLPRDLIITDHPSDRYLELAESGLFNVYLVDSEGAWRVDVAQHGDCALRREERSRYAAMTAFRFCGIFVKTSATPETALLLRPWVRPLPTGDAAQKSDLKKRDGWAIQLSLKENGSEELVAYAESVKRRVLDRIGIAFFTRYEMQPSRQFPSGTERPDPLEFLYRSLDIDPVATTPSNVARPADAAAAAAALLANKDKRSAKAILQIAAAMPDKIPGLAAALQRIASDRNLGESIWHSPIDCAYASGLVRYVREIGEGCDARPRDVRPCGALGSVEDWHKVCSVERPPVWPQTGGKGPRIFVDGLFSGVVSDITTTERARYPFPVKQIIVPSDRGSIDIAVHGEGLWKFAGATSCLARVTVVASHAGVIGVPPGNVRFIGYPSHDFEAGGHNALSGTLTPKMRETLGAEPTVVIVDDRETSLKLGDFLVSSESGGSCAGSSIAPWSDALQASPIAVDIGDVVLAPFEIPIHYRKE